MNCLQINKSKKLISSTLFHQWLALERKRLWKSKSDFICGKRLTSNTISAGVEFPRSLSTIPNWALRKKVKMNKQLKYGKWWKSLTINQRDVISTERRKCRQVSINLLLYLPFFRKELGYHSGSLLLFDRDFWHRHVKRMRIW